MGLLQVAAAAQRAGKITEDEVSVLVRSVAGGALRPARASSTLDGYGYTGEPSPVKKPLTKKKTKPVDADDDDEDCECGEDDDDCDCDAEPDEEPDEKAHARRMGRDPAYARAYRQGMADAHAKNHSLEARQGRAAALDPDPYSSRGILGRAGGPRHVDLLSEADGLAVRLGHNGVAGLRAAHAAAHPPPADPAWQDRRTHAENTAAMRAADAKCAQVAADTSRVTSWRSWSPGGAR